MLTKLLNLPVLEWNIVELRALFCRTITAKSTFDIIEAWLVKCIKLGANREVLKTQDRQVSKTFT